MQQFEKKLESLWRGPTVARGLLAIALIGACYCAFCVPKPGVSIGLLAVCAAVMSIRPWMGPYEKITWLVVLVAFTTTEIRSIRQSERQNLADQRDQNAKFKDLSDTQRQDFLDTMHGVAATIDKENKVYENDRTNFAKTEDALSRNLKSATSIFEQTRPIALVQFVDFRFETDRRIVWGSGKPFGITLQFRNYGADTARQVYKFGKFYYGTESDLGLKTVAKQFSEDWDREKKGPSPLMPNQARLENETESGFNSQQMNQVASHKAIIYFLFKAEYEDDTGRWASSTCRILNPLATSSGVEDEVQCNDLPGVNVNDARYRISRPKRK